MDNLIKLKEEDNPNYIWLYGSELANSIVSSSGTVSTLTCTGGATLS